MALDEEKPVQKPEETEKKDEKAKPKKDDDEFEQLDEKDIRLHSRYV